MPAGSSSRRAGAPHRRLDLDIRDDAPHARCRVLRQHRAALQALDALHQPLAIVVDDRDSRVGIDVVRVAGDPVAAVRVVHSDSHSSYRCVVHEAGLPVQEALDLRIAMCASRAACSRQRACRASDRSASRSAATCRAGDSRPSCSPDVPPSGRTLSRCRPRPMNEPVVTLRLHADLVALHDLDVVGRDQPAGPKPNSCSRSRASLISSGAPLRNSGW